MGEVTRVVVLADEREVGRSVPPEERTLPWGLLKGKIWIAPDFGDPLPDDVLDAFEAWEG